MEIDQCYVNFQVTDLWEATFFSLVDRNQRFGETCCFGLQLESRSVLTNIETCVPNCKPGDPNLLATAIAPHTVSYCICKLY
jgi:hypothetical protein